MKRYNAYKPSGIEWIGNIPEEWSIKKIKHLFNVYAGATPETKNKNYWDGDIVWITPADYKTVDKIILGGSRNITKEGLNSCNTQIVPKGSLIFSKRAPIGTVAISGVELCTNQGCLSCVSKCVNTTFFYYAISVFTEIFDMLGSGATFKEISADAFVNVKLPVPSSLEQEIIVSYLDAKCAKIDNVLSVQQKRIELLKELKQSIITNAVTKGLDKNVEFKPSGIEWIGDIPEKWTLMKLKHICKDEKYSIKTGPFGSQLKGEDLREEGDVRVYNQRNVIDDCFDDVQFFVTSAKAKDLQSFFTKENDLLVTSRGTIGKCSILPKTAPMGVLHPCLIALRINEKKCSLRWAKFFINESDCFKTNVFLNSNATTIEVIYTDTLKGIFIPLPPIKEQLEIISYLERKCSAIDNQISKIERQIELLKEYKQSIITECVTGKRKVC